MIVRNAADSLRPCLESARPFVDEIIVLDTGSEDRTVEIAQVRGAEVHHFRWCDDFSAARNVSLSHATGDWIFLMDADDSIPAECGAKLHELTFQPSNVLGVAMPYIHCPLTSGFVVVDQVKLVRNRQDLRFEGRVHEQILPSIRRAGGDVVGTDVYIVHSGADFSRVTRERKRDYYSRLMALDLLDRPGDPLLLFHQGMTLFEGDDFAGAIGPLEASIAAAGQRKAYVAKAYVFLVDSLRQLNQPGRAEHACAAALRQFPEEKELHFARGLLAYCDGRFRDAIDAYEFALALPPPPHHEAVIRAFPNERARFNLALAYLEDGHPGQAEKEWRTVVERAPQNREAWDGLAEAYLRQSKYREAEQVVERLCGIKGQLLLARVALGRGKDREARELVKNIDCGDDPDNWRAYAQLLFEAGWSDLSERAIRRWIQADPHDPAAHHNLGVLLTAAGRPDASIPAFVEALRLRPDFPASVEQLARALEQLGRTVEAQRVRRRAVEAKGE